MRKVKFVWFSLMAFERAVTVKPQMCKPGCKIQHITCKKKMKVRIQAICFLQVIGLCTKATNVYS
jgi:hypothetical protein